MLGDKGFLRTPQLVAFLQEAASKEEEDILRWALVWNWKTEQSSSFQDILVGLLLLSAKSPPTAPKFLPELSLFLALNGWSSSPFPSPFIFIFSQKGRESTIC